MNEPSTYNGTPLGDVRVTGRSSETVPDADGEPLYELVTLTLEDRAAAAA